VLPFLAAPGALGIASIPMQRIDPERWEKCRRLARTLLMVGPNGEDLVRKYLGILIDHGLPRPERPRHVLIVGAGIAGLVAAKLLKEAGHRVTVVEANEGRIGGRLKTFRSGFKDPRQYAEAGAMRLPNTHPLVLALADSLGLRRRLFYNVDVDPATGSTDGPVPPVVYQPFDGSGEWRNGRDQPDFRPPDKLFHTWIRTNGRQVRRSEYAASPEAVNIGFHMPPAERSRTANDLINAALEPVRDYYSVVDPETGRRRLKPFDEWVEGWARLIYDFDQHSMWDFLKEIAGFCDETIEAIGTLENLTSRLHLAFFHSFLGRSDINPLATYWEIEGGNGSLPSAFRRFLGEDELRLDRRLIRMEYWEPETRGMGCRHVGPEGPRVFIRTASENGETFEDFTGDLAIVTIPFSSLRHVVVSPQFSYRKRRAIIELHYDSATKVLLEFSKRWWEFDEEDWRRELDAIEPGLYDRYRGEPGGVPPGSAMLGAHRDVDETEIADQTKTFYDAYHPVRQPARAAGGFFGGGSVTDNPNRFIYYPSHRVEGSEGGVVLASYTWADDAARWDSMNDGERYAYALRGLAALHGRRVEAFYTGMGKTQSWLRNRFAFGEAAVFMPWQLTQFHLDIPAPEGPIHFAGEHTSLKHAWVEGAIESAVRAALEVNEAE